MLSLSSSLRVWKHRGLDCLLSLWTMWPQYMWFLSLPVATVQRCPEGARRSLQCCLVRSWLQSPGAHHPRLVTPLSSWSVSNPGCRWCWKSLFGQVCYPLSKVPSFLHAEHSPAASLLKREKEDMEWGGSGRRTWGRGTVFRIHCMKKIYFRLKNKVGQIK